MDEPRTFRFLVLNDSTAHAKEIRLSLWKIVTFASLSVILIGAAVYTTAWAISFARTQRAVSGLVSENEALHQHIGEISSRLTQVDTMLARLAQSDDQLRMIADLPQINADTREVGVGGLGGASGTNDFVSEEDGSDDGVRSILYDLDKIEREIRLQNSSFTEIRRQLGAQTDLLEHTPSIRPVDIGFYSSGYGYRRDPFTHRRRHHDGLDIVAPRGTPVAVTADGKVISASRAAGFGKVVVVDHGYGFKTLYGHLSTVGVYQGQVVKRGDKIGTVGSTGRSTGPHLHYEVRVNNKAVDPIDYVFGNDIAGIIKER